jgi:quercetin dioxygenase-like cupin family protein
MAAKKRAATKAKATTRTKTAGAVKGGQGKYQFTLAKVKDVPAGTGYSTSHGGVVEGQRMLVGYIHKARGTGSRMHTHKNEQFNYVVRGTLVGSVNGKPVKAPAGTLIYIPANAPHTLVAAADDEDVIFIAIKDLSQGIIGRAVDGKMTGPHYEKGFAPGRATK